MNAPDGIITQLDSYYLLNSFFPRRELRDRPITSKKQKVRFLGQYNELIEVLRNKASECIACSMKSRGKHNSEETC